MENLFVILGKGLVTPGYLLVVDHLIPKVPPRAPPRLIRRSDLQQLRPTTPTLWASQSWERYALDETK